MLGWLRWVLLNERSVLFGLERLCLWTERDVEMGVFGLIIVIMIL